MPLHVGGDDLLNHRMKTEQSNRKFNLLLNLFPFPETPFD